MTTEAEKKTAEVLDKVEKGKELTPAEQRAYDRAMAEANEEQGYEPFAYHGQTMFRILESPAHTFAAESDAQQFVMRMRLNRNLQGLG